MISKIFSPVGLVVSIVPTIAWIFSVYTHVTSSEWLLSLVVFFIPPIGAIDGIGMFFGWW